LDHPDHALRAVQAAFEILREIAELHPAKPEERNVGVSLGIATGTAVAGQINVSARSDYTVVGEVVTLAERVSALGSDDQVLVDPATYEQIQNDFEAREVHTLRARGKKDGLIIREVREKIKIPEKW
jgi:adenylate cyclase